MAKEDFEKTGTEPIDMDDYPYKAGDKLDNGIQVLAVIKGDETDSFGGYLVKPIIDHKGAKKIYGEPYLMAKVPFKDRHGVHPLLDVDSYPADAESIEMVGPVGDPYAQRVTYRLPDEKTSHNATPQEFLKIAKAGKPPVFEGSEKSEKATGDHGTGWTAEDDKFIEENYVRMSDNAMAEHLGVDVAVLKAHRLEMGLKKQPFGRK